MSFEYYSKWWVISKKHLEKLYATDELFRKRAKPINDRFMANELIGGLYAKYCLLVQELDACLDQMAQPQKRITIRKLVDSAVLRLSELNDEMRKIDISEYHYIDGTLVELKLVPHDIEILHPALTFPRPLNIEEMWQKLQKGDDLFSTRQLTADKSEDEINPHRAESKLRRRTPTNLPNIEMKVSTEEHFIGRIEKRDLSNFIELIQTAERARQERMYFFVSKSVLEEKKRTKELAMLGFQPKQVGNDLSFKASEKLQAWWRGCSTRQMLRAKDITRGLLIGMYEPSWKSKFELRKFQENLTKRRAYRDQRIREYIEGINKEELRILRVVGPGLMEDIGDEIREWFKTWYIGAKTFDKFPPESKGGTILVVRGETMTPKEYLDEYERKRREKVKNKGVDKQKEKEKQDKLKKEAEEKKKKDAEKKKKTAEAKKKKKKKPDEYEFEYKETGMITPYQKGITDHSEMWDKINDFDNPLETYYLNMITEQKCYENQLEMRRLVDDVMRIELDFLKEALEADKIRLKGKKGKGGKKKAAKNKKNKKGKKGKKDPTGDKTIEDLFQELFNNGIIRTYEPTRLEDYKGDFSYNTWNLRKQNFDPPATLLDVRQAVVLNCILPLGVETMKRPRSVLLAGPRQSGKHLLANAIFTETQCVLFDLSPEVTAGKYPGAAGLKMLFHLVNKMSRLLSPSIIFFDGAEKIFYKKVPKEERQLDPKRIGKKLFKEVIKAISPQDKILVLGQYNDNFRFLEEYYYDIIVHEIY